MVSLFSIVVLASCLNSLGFAAYISELTDNNFYDYAKDKDILLVDFYAPWCSDCKKLEPEFDKAAQVLDSRSMDLAKVDCFGAGQGLCQMYGVRSWPQLKTFRKGTYTGEYQGVQTGDSMALYVESLSGQQQQSAEAQVANSPNVNQAPYSYAVPAGAPSTANDGKAKGKAENGVPEIKTHAKTTIHDATQQHHKTKHSDKKITAAHAGKESESASIRKKITSKLHEVVKNAKKSLKESTKSKAEHPTKEDKQ